MEEEEMAVTFPPNAPILILLFCLSLLSSPPSTSNTFKAGPGNNHQLMGVIIMVPSRSINPQCDQIISIISQFLNEYIHTFPHQVL